MKNVLIFLVTFASFSAHADTTSQFIQDGTTLQAVQRQLAQNIDGKNVVVTDYSKSWNAYNPMSWVVDPGRKYRSITFEFLNNEGKKQTFNCSVSITRGSSDLFAYDCSGGDKSFRYYHKLFKYGYAEDSIFADGVINNASHGSSDSSNKAGSVR